MLAAAMLAVGVAVGAAIGPAPDASLAGASRVPLLLTMLPALSSPSATSRAAPPPAVTAQATPPPATTSSSGSSAPSSAASSPSSSSTPAPSSPSTPAPTPAGGGSKTTLPPVTKVWLIELAGTTFEEALAQPSAAPYIDAQAVPAGALLSSWSGLDASAFASDAALLASTPPQLIDTIVQPPCPEGAAGAQCIVGTPGGLTAANTFLQAVVPTITANAAYRSNGLIVVTFGSVANASATELPTGAATATLTSQPPAGVLLISPFVSAGTRPSTTSFNPASPTKSLEKLLHQ